jgi:hypothetical protein
MPHDDVRVVLDLIQFLAAEREIGSFEFDDEASRSIVFLCADRKV